MAKIDLTSREWCELVFEGKNKAYGAYEMRQTSPSRHNKALVIVVIFILIAFSLPFLLKAVANQEDKETMTEVTSFADLDTPEEEPEQQELKKPDLPPPPPLKSTIKFTPPVIKKDEEVREEDEMKTQEDLNLNKTAISIADIKGTDDIHGKDIADIREVVKEPVEEKKQEIYHTVEQMPQFPGGETELLKYIRDNLQYPQAALENNIQGRVIVQFVVGKDGKVTNVQILKGVDRLCDQEAVRVIESMPQWIPGKHNGVAVPVYYRVPVTFKILR